MVQHQQVMTDLFRYHKPDIADRSRSFNDGAIPTAEGIRSTMDGSTDVGFKAYLDRIPLGMRQLRWSMLSAAAGSQLQQRDDESEATPTSSSGDMAFGVDSVCDVRCRFRRTDGLASQMPMMVLCVASCEFVLETTVSLVVGCWKPPEVVGCSNTQR